MSMFEGRTGQEVAKSTSTLEVAGAQMDKFRSRDESLVARGVVSSVAEAREGLQPLSLQAFQKLYS